jgi:hypothetical protein
MRYGFILTVVVMLCALLTACGSRTVYALDYPLEEKLYSEQQTEPGEMQAPEPTEDMDELNEMTSAEENAMGAETVLPAAVIETANNESEVCAQETPKTSNAVDMTNPQETPRPADDDYETSSSFRYTVVVCKQNGDRLPNARIKLYMDGALLYSAVSDTDGTAAWMLPTEHSFFITASMEGYETLTSGEKRCETLQETQMTITLLEQIDDAENDINPTTTPEPTLQPIPVPTNKPATVSFAASDVSVEAGDEEFTLIDGVIAQNESGEGVSVWVINEGGFSAETAGEYTISYGYMENDMLRVATRIVTVQGEQTRLIEETANAPMGNSKERYEVLIAYRNEIFDELTTIMEDLELRLAAEVARLEEGKTNVRLLMQVVPEESSEEYDMQSYCFAQGAEVKVGNWSDILATFIVQNSIDIETPLDLLNLRLIPLENLANVFWDMNHACVVQTDQGTDILLYSKTYEDMIDEYNMDEQQRDLLYELMQPEFQRTFASLTGNHAFESASEAEIEEALSSLGDLEAERVTVVETAYSLVGRISYLYGGKFNALGWNSKWGMPQNVTVTDENGEKATKSKICGLDCSGYVSWVFINAMGAPSVIDAIGNGTSNQWSHSKPISWDEGRPGDLAFYAVPGEKEYNHVGIIVSVDDDGSYLVAHCSSKKNGVIVTEAWSTGFRYLRRPFLYGD